MHKGSRASKAEAIAAIFAIATCCCTGKAPTPTLGLQELPTMSAPAPLVRAVALEPHVEMDGRPSAVVVPLPKDRVRFRRVEVWLSVKRRGDSKTADSQHAVFSRNTVGDALRFYLPLLPPGPYEAEVKSIALVDTLDRDGSLIVEEKESSAVISVVFPDNPASKEVTETIVFHFKYHLAHPIDAEWRAPEAARKKIARLTKEGKLVRAEIDCWASAEGNDAFNQALSERRCAWFKNQVWKPIQSSAHGTTMRDIAHGANDLPFQGAEENRVVVLKLVSSER